MKANRKKLMLAMARACMDTEDLQKAAEMPRPTLNNAICGKSVRPYPNISNTLKRGLVEIVETCRDCQKCQTIKRGHQNSDTLRDANKC